MQRATFNPRTFSVLVFAIGLITLQGLHAQERQEYVSTAPSTKVLQEDLAAFEGKEANIIKFELSPGWVGDKHYHTGDVFVYVLEGAFAVEVEGEGRKEFGQGEVYHEAVNKVMQARNPSKTEAAKILVFQVGEKGEPLMIKAD